ncbi:hypothetical protein [Arthrobacter sp. FW306-07-I]|uniref:hypothetical protein n=1 Tax=Arthrobacter sp. FW306-07-I TaxID=2879622 RepID=UPI001F3DF79A|nr:hypothetical protein [Arthrobacter sp. FW306-07-I]UKA77592.1 hypothetical protein LFT46_19335 [Arthrobacter sp. FW306-07-I]
MDPNCASGCMNCRETLGNQQQSTASAEWSPASTISGSPRRLGGVAVLVGMAARAHVCVPSTGPP